jgi:hypothetical protein
MMCHDQGHPRIQLDCGKCQLGLTQYHVHFLLILLLNLDSWLKLLSDFRLQPSVLSCFIVVPRFAGSSRPEVRFQFDPAFMAGASLFKLMGLARSFLCLLRGSACRGNGPELMCPEWRSGLAGVRCEIQDELFHCRSIAQAMTELGQSVPYPPIFFLQHSDLINCDHHPRSDYPHLAMDQSRKPCWIGHDIKESPDLICIWRHVREHREVNETDPLFQRECSLCRVPGAFFPFGFRAEINDRFATGRRIDLLQPTAGECPTSEELARVHRFKMVQHAVPINSIGDREDR